MSLFAKVSTYDERSARLAGIGLMLLSIFMFSFGDALGKFMVGSYSVGQLLWLRACAALLVLLPMIWKQRAEFNHLERPWLQLLRVTLSTLEVAAFFLATVYLPLADVITYYLASPIFVTALSGIVLGERFVIPSRTQTSAVFAAFQTASGDTHPIHYDVEYCRARGMPNLLAHGFQTLLHTAPGSGLFPFMVEESLVGFLEQSSRFLKPVFADDTIYPALEVGELTPGRITGVVTLRSTVFNQRRELVLEGLQKFLIRRRP